MQPKQPNLHVILQKGSISTSHGAVSVGCCFSQAFQPLRDRHIRLAAGQLWPRTGDEEVS